MSSKIIDTKYYEIDDTLGNPFQVKNIIVPFTSFFGIREKFIYTGEEKIPFQKRHPLYKSIMLDEFREELLSN